MNVELSAAGWLHVDSSSSYRVDETKEVDALLQQCTDYHLMPNNECDWFVMRLNT